MIQDFIAQITAQDIAAIGLLIFMEGILSIDNALVIAVIARGLPKEQQMKALTYGLIGAVVFRILALFSAALLMQWIWVKYVGGAYLIWVAVSHWLKKGPEELPAGVSAAPKSFWKTVILIELTDVAFAVDSILAAVAVSSKLWVVITGGLIGLICMRFAAKTFIVILQKFPNFELSAYLMVFGVGIKLIIDGMKLPGIDFHSSSSPASWVFWGYALLSVAVGFIPGKKKSSS